MFMRKLFSLIAAVLFAGSMFAAEVTVSKSIHDLFPDDANGTQEATLFSDAFITISVNKDGNNGKVYGTGTEWRLYQTNNAVVTVAATNATIKTVAFEFTVKNNAVLNYGDNAMESNTAVNVNAASAQFVVANSTSATNGQIVIKSFIVVYEAGDAPAVAAPVIAGDEVFFDSTIVTMTCATTDADIYYTTDGTTDPKCDCSAAPEYKKAFVLKATTTVKAAAYTGNDWSAVSEKTFTKAPEFASFEALIAAQLANNSLVKVSFENIKIDSIYQNKSGKKNGIYFAVNNTAYEIYYNKAELPETWVEDGTVSGTINGKWSEYNGIWEVVPVANDWAWTELTYVAPAAAGCDWDNIEFFNVGLAPEDENYNQFKICKAGENPNIVNIQVAPWADNNKGIYINFPSAEFTTISLPEGQYKVDGAGILLYLTAFTAKETEVTINYKGEDCIFTVYNVKGGAGTAIDNTVVSEKAIKMFENGQLIIIKNGVKYNALGSVIE